MTRAAENQEETGFGQRVAGQESYEGPALDAGRDQKGGQSGNSQAGDRGQQDGFSVVRLEPASGRTEIKRCPARNCHTALLLWSGRIKNSCRGRSPGVSGRPVACKVAQGTATTARRIGAMRRAIHSRVLQSARNSDCRIEAFGDEIDGALA